MRRSFRTRADRYTAVCAGIDGNRATSYAPTDRRAAEIKGIEAGTNRGYSLSQEATMGTKVRTDRWHNTGGNGPASAVWCRKRGDKSVVISVHRSNVVVDHWERNDADSSDPFAPGYVRTLEGGFWPDLKSAQKAADEWLGVPARKSRAAGKKFSVVGFYHDNQQPFVSWERCATPQEASEKAQERRANHAVTIVEVFHGHNKGILENDEVIHGN